MIFALIVAGALFLVRDRAARNMGFILIALVAAALLSGCAMKLDPIEVEPWMRGMSPETARRAEEIYRNAERETWEATAPSAPSGPVFCTHGLVPYTTVCSR